jgi:hypothetical protein
LVFVLCIGMVIVHRCDGIHVDDEDNDSDVEGNGDDDILPEMKAAPLPRK